MKFILFMYKTSIIFNLNAYTNISLFLWSGLNASAVDRCIYASWRSTIGSVYIILDRVIRPRHKSCLLIKITLCFNINFIAACEGK